MGAESRKERLRAASARDGRWGWGPIAEASGSAQELAPLRCKRPSQACESGESGVVAPESLLRHPRSGSTVVLDWLRSVFGGASWVEIALVCLWFVVVVLHKHLPRLGAAIGGWFDRQERQP